MKAAFLSLLVLVVLLCQSPAQQGEKQLISGTVIQRTEDGVLVDCGGIGAQGVAGVIFVTGKVGDYLNGQNIHVWAVRDGSYSYKPKAGEYAMLPKFTLQ